MGSSDIKNIVHQYYEGWTEQDLEKSRALLSDDLTFRSPQDKFTSADEFIVRCGHFSEGLKGVQYKKEVYSKDEAFVILEWEMEDGSCFMDAEYLRIENDKIKEIIVVNNFPEFGDMLK